MRVRIIVHLAMIAFAATLAPPTTDAAEPKQCEVNDGVDAHGKLQESGDMLPKRPHLSRVSVRSTPSHADSTEILDSP